MGIQDRLTWNDGDIEIVKKPTKKEAGGSSPGKKESLRQKVEKIKKALHETKK